MQGAIVASSKQQNKPKEITMHDKIKLIREALNAAQDAELKLSGAAIVELEAVNKYLFELEENLA
jgi:2,4-dienoyl-CoA reductase-like NADH-dependent reductase (Old Yellow Enzyme family)